MQTTRQRIMLIDTFRGELTLWIGGLALVVLLCVGLYVGQVATRQMTATGGQALHAAANTAATLLGANLRERELEIHLLSQSPHFSKQSLDHPDILSSMDRRKRARSEYAWIGVADAQGIVRQATGNMLLGQSVAARPWFQAASQGAHTGDLHEAVLLAKLLPGSRDGAPLRFIDFAAPLYSPSGEWRGVLGAHAHWNWVTDTVQAATTLHTQREQVDLLIANRHGDIIFPEVLAVQGRAPPAPGLATPYAVVRWENGRDYLTSQVKVNAQTETELGWRIIVRQPIEAALQPVRTLRAQLFWSGLLAAALFGLLSYRLALKMSRPIEALAEAARRAELRDETLTFPQDLRMQEIAQLSQSMQSMTRSLLVHELELEQQVAERTEALTLANQELSRLATQDSLTGVSNRRSFDTRLAESFRLFKRNGHGHALLMIDIDHFKSVDDVHGHQTGDEVLRQVAQILVDTLRTTDFVARYGGEEFAVLIPDTTDAGVARGVAEKLRAAIHAADFPRVGRLTASLGMSLSDTTDTAPDQLVQRADTALYQAKHAGRNCVAVVLAGAPSDPPVAAG